MKTIFGTHDQTSNISIRQRRQHMGGGGDITKNCLLCQTYRIGPDIFHYLKVVINVLCLSSVALPCVFRFAIFFFMHFTAGTLLNLENACP